MQEKEELEATQKEELNQFNIEKDKKFYELTNEFQENLLKWKIKKLKKPIKVLIMKILIFP